MDLRRFSPTALWQRRKACFTFEALLAVLTLILVGAFHGVVFEDRLLLNLYYIGIVAAAYALVKRHALALTVLVVCVAAGTTLAQIYFTAEPETGNPLLDPVFDFATWSVLLLLAWRLAAEAYHFQTEEYRLQMQRTIEEKAIATRAAALTSTSHEVRQPLSAILAITETLLDDSTESLEEWQRDFLADIDKSAKHLMDLVNNMLDYAKAEAGMIKLARETVALPELVDQCVRMTEPRAKENGITITAQLDPAVEEIVADPLRLKQVLLNLLSNAVKFNESSGFVRMQVRGNGKNVVISVRDTGRGITPGQTEHLFDPYYQAAHGDQGVGTGLGLSIIKHLVELHGGSISVDSVPGSGSVFTVQIPSGVSPGREDELPLPGEETDKPGTEETGAEDAHVQKCVV